MTNKIETLKKERDILVDNLRKAFNGKRDKEIIEKISTIDKEINNEKILQKLAQVNAAQTRKRELAKLVWECEMPVSDPTNNDGTFNKIKVKKYPKLAALQYAYGKWENGVLKSITIQGESFNLYNVSFNGYGQGYTYARYESFSDFLKANIIMAEDMTIENLAEIMAENESANRKLETAIKEHSETLQKIGIYSLNCYGLFSQSQKHISEYRVNI